MAEKSFQWNPSDEFILKGLEFNLLLDVIREQLSTPEAQRVFALQQVYNILEKKLEVRQ